MINILDEKLKLLKLEPPREQYLLNLNGRGECKPCKADLGGTLWYYDDGITNHCMGMQWLLFCPICGIENPILDQYKYLDFWKNNIVGKQILNDGLKALKNIKLHHSTISRFKANNKGYVFSPPAGY